MHPGRSWIRSRSPTRRRRIPPRAPGEDPLTGYLSQGDTRPFAAVRTLHFDVADLPLGKWADPSRPHGFRVAPLGTQGYRIRIESTLYAEVTVANTRRSLEFTAFTGGSFSMGVPPECGRGHIGRFPAHWTGIDPRRWTDDDVGVELGSGDFDVQVCRADARATVETRAHAIVPGFAYALRVKQEADEGEALVVFMPHAAMVSASGNPSFPLEQANAGPFTRLTFPLQGAGGRSAALRVSTAALRLWSRLRRTIAPVMSYQESAPAKDDLLVGLDVVQQAGTTMGTLTLSLPGKRDPRPYAKVLSAARDASAASTASTATE